MACSARPLEDLVGVLPVILERLALDGEHRRALDGDGGGGVVLRRIDVARGPAHLGAERLQRLDEHRGLDGHVQGAGDARALQRLALRELLADRHEAGHLGLGDVEFLAAPLGERKIGNVIIRLGGRLEIGVHDVLQRSVASAVSLTAPGILSLADLVSVAALLRTGVAAARGR